MKTISAAKFREQCPSLLDRVEPDGIVITKRGKPVGTVSEGLIGSLHVFGWDPRERGY